MLKTMSAPLAVNMLTAIPPEETSFPLNVDTRDVVPVGESWAYAIKQDPASGSFNPSYVRTVSLKAWWMG